MDQLTPYYIKRTLRQNLLCITKRDFESSTIPSLLLLGAHATSNPSSTCYRFSSSYYSTMNFAPFRTLGYLAELEFAAAAPINIATAFDHGLLGQNSMQELLPCSWNGESDSTLSLSEPKADYIFDALHPPSDQSLLFSKQSHGFLYLDNHKVTRDESCQSTPNMFEKLKTWLWMKRQHPFVSRPSRCLPVKWLDIISLEHLGAIIRAPPIKKWLNCKRKQKLCLHEECVQAALSVASVAAALATAAASTAACSMDEKESRTGRAVASAAALVATHFADFAEQTGADYRAVLASVSSGGSVKYATDISELTASASASLEAASTFQKEARVHSARESPCFTVRSGHAGMHAECSYKHEILARGGFFLLRFTAGKLHWRFISVFLDEDKQVILKLRSRHFGGAFSKTEKRVVFQILVSVRAWIGRSLLNNGIERHYFGLATPQGTIEFECATDFDHQLWTEGISHLLCVAKQ